MSDRHKDKKSHRPGKSKLPFKQRDSLSEQSSGATSFRAFTLPSSSESLAPRDPSLPQQSFSKVAIPRLHRASEGQSTTDASTVGDKSRVTHACEPCRSRKTKCSGERPTCKHCADFDLACVYSEGKRDRARKQFLELAEKLDEYEKLLKEARPHLNTPMQERVSQALERELSPGLDLASPAAFREEVFPKVDGFDESLSTDGENRYIRRAGSVEPSDNIKEDFDRDPAARATGYHGKNSEITWMQRLRQRLNTNDNFVEDGLTTGPSPFMVPINSSTYHCDDLPITLPEHLVDPYERPPKIIADALFQSYLDTVHSTFPIIGKATFIQQYQSFYSHDLAPNDHWLAILNCIFAIGAKYAHLIGADWRGDERDHLVFFTRSRKLALNFDSILDHAGLQRVQVCALMAFYLKACYQMNRAWTCVGMSMRYATALGLNLRNDSQDVQELSKEIRYRVWWAVCSIEQQLASMTGRATCLTAGDSSTPMPMPVDESQITKQQAKQSPSSEESKGRASSISSGPSKESREGSVYGSSRSYSTDHFLKVTARRKGSKPFSGPFEPNEGLYFLHHVKLNIFTIDVLNDLYRAADPSKTWAQIQVTISELDRNLSYWYEELPEAFDFTRATSDQRWLRQRMNLGLSYYSIRMNIHRPCLCSFDGLPGNQSAAQRELSIASAVKCVHAACDMLAILPDAPEPTLIFTHSAWWNLVHYLVEAAVVCMLELSFQSDHMPHEADKIFHAAGKAVGWLHSIPAEDVAASRAASLCEYSFRKVALRMGRVVESTPSMSRPGQRAPTWQPLSAAAMLSQPAYPGDVKQTAGQTPNPFLVDGLSDGELFDAQQHLLQTDPGTWTDKRDSDFWQHE